MKMITNLWKPAGGTVELFGELLTPKSYGVLGRIGSILEFPVFYDHLTGYENMLLHCEYMDFHKPDSIKKALDTLELSDAADKQVKNYSLGMKERLGIARAVVCEPELLILDEPTNGLDPAGIKQIRSLLKKLCRERGMTVMISSHILSEIESIADTVGIIHHGRMVKESTMQDIREMGREYIRLSVSDTQKAMRILVEKMGLADVKVMDDGEIRIYDRTAATEGVSKVLSMENIGIVSLYRESDTLEDFFLKLTREADADV